MSEHLQLLTTAEEQDWGECASFAGKWELHIWLLLGGGGYLKQNYNIKDLDINLKIK